MQCLDGGASLLAGQATLDAQVVGELALVQMSTFGLDGDQGGLRLRGGLLAGHGE